MSLPMFNLNFEQKPNCERVSRICVCEIYIYILWYVYIYIMFFSFDLMIYHLCLCVPLCEVGNKLRVSCKEIRFYCHFQVSH
jgi:hypothetical protein